MKITEVFQTMDIFRDEKARRRLNIADDVVPNIDVHTLENGVTIEQLENLNVPVLQYQTQITIHGKFRLGNVNLPNGLIWNQNQSLGVRYSLIDFEKKKRLQGVSYLAKSGWRVSIDSQECVVYKMFTDKQSTIDCYNNVNSDLFVGRKEAVALIYGRFAVIITVNAIYEKDFWSFCKAFFGVDEQGYLDLKREESERQEIAKNLYQQAYQERQKSTQILKETIESMGYAIYAGKIKSGFYLRLNSITGEMNLLHLKVTAKRITAHSKRIESVDEISTFDYVGKKGKFIDPKYLKNLYLVKLDAEEKPAPVVNHVAKVNNSDGIRIEHVGTWTWVYFSGIPSVNNRYKLKQMGGQYSDKRKAWYFRSVVSDEQLEFLKA
jgi:hypothetical protein